LVFAVTSAPLSLSAQEGGNPAKVDTATRLLDGRKYLQPPLSLSGFVLVVLYLVFRRIIETAPAGAWPSHLHGSLLEKIIMYLFILALTAMLLGFIGWMAELWAKVHEPERALSGIVIDDDDQPVGGAEVFVEGLEERQKITQPNGNFELRVPSRPTYTLRVRAGGAAATLNIAEAQANQAVRIILRTPRTRSDSRSPAGGTLQFVDVVAVTNPETGSEFPLLEAKLRNKGKASAVLKRVEISPVERLIVDECSRFVSAAPARWHVDIDLDGLAPFVLGTVVPPDGVGNFQLVVGHDLDRAGYSGYYRLRIEATYDEDDKRIASNEFWINIPARLMNLVATVVPGDQLSECFKQRDAMISTVRNWPQGYSLPKFPR